MSSWQSHFTWKVTGPCTFHSALCKLHYYAWQLDVNSSDGDEIEGLKAVSWQWGGDFWLYQILLCFHWLRLAAVICIRVVHNLETLAQVQVQKLMEENRKVTEENRKLIEDNQRWKQGFFVGLRSQGEISWWNYEMLRAVVVDHFWWGTEGEMFCFASGVSWCQMTTTHITRHGFQTQVGGEGGRGGKTLDGGNPLLALTACLQRPAPRLRFLRRQPCMYWLVQSCPDGQRERRMQVHAVALVVRVAG